MTDILCGGLTIFSVAFVLWCLWSLCRGEIPFSKKARDNKTAKMVLGAARTFILSYEDLPEYQAGGEFGVRMQQLRDAWTTRKVDDCKSLLDYLDPPRSCAVGREWLDILVVSISVAMAFRAYLYEPFHIPTGSMQPTLYGNHSEACSPEQATFWDKTPGLRWYKWFLTGKMYECYRAPFDGVVSLQPNNAGCYEMRVETRKFVNGTIQTVSSGKMIVPSDVFFPTQTGDSPDRGPAQMPNGIHDRSSVRQGDLLWCGYVESGDFLFVNRWLWNFRHPKRGDVMVFSTTGICPNPDLDHPESRKYNGRQVGYLGAPYVWSDGQTYDTYALQQGTHYIKRMTGLPGETLSIVATDEADKFELRVNGEKPMEPRRIAQIQNREKWHEKAYSYAGYRPGGHPACPGEWRTLCQPGDQVKLGPDEYFACGDNSPSSYDSRYWGPVPARNLCGIAGGVFWPILSHRWGPIE